MYDDLSLIAYDQQILQCIKDNQDTLKNIVLNSKNNITQRTYYLWWSVNNLLAKHIGTDIYTTDQGVYMIRNTENGKVYIGSSVNIEHRWKQHKEWLIKNKHHSYKLQDEYNIKKDINLFEFIIIERVDDISQLLNREQYWMDYYNAYELGYNCTRNADGSDIIYNNAK